MAGLVRKKVTVRSKRGKTYQRSVMVRSGSSPSKSRRQLDMKQADHILKRGLANAGMGVGAAIGGRKMVAHHMAGGAIAGAAGGYGLGHLLSKTKLSRNARAGIGIAGHALGMGAAVGNMIRVYKHAVDQLGQSISAPQLRIRFTNPSGYRAG